MGTTLTCHDNSGGREGACESSGATDFGYHSWLPRRGRVVELLLVLGRASIWFHDTSVYLVLSPKAHPVPYIQEACAPPGWRASGLEMLRPVQPRPCPDSGMSGGLVQN